MKWFALTLLVFFSSPGGIENSIFNKQHDLRQILENLAKKKTPSQLSFKECNLDPGFRLDCGYFGIDEEQCYKRECCWGETDTPDVPWCYHSNSAIDDRCMVSGEEKIECGSYGIRKEQCLASNCCWQPSNVNGEPWCYHYKRTEIRTGECGIPAIPPNVHRTGSRIVGGTEAKAHSWPWQVGLQLEGYGHFCGGSIINRHWILSAAHCENSFYYGNVIVVAGAHGVHDDATSRQVIKVKDTFTHENFTMRAFDCDVMLIHLEEPIKYLDEVSPICLPEPGKRIRPGTRCYITGWGTLELHGENPEYLQQTTTPIIAQETCVDWYTDPEHWYPGIDEVPVTENMVCTGFEEGGRGACHGDSGGPMVCFNEDHWEQTGIASWTGPCSRERTPTVYVRVSELIDWIENVINEHPE